MKVNLKFGFVDLNLWQRDAPQTISYWKHNEFGMIPTFSQFFMRVNSCNDLG